MTTKQAIKLKINSGTTIDLYYLDGVVIRFDVLSLVPRYPQFQALQDRTLLEKGHLLGWSSVIWNQDLDLDVELVYEEGTPVSEEYDDIDATVIGFLLKQRRLELGYSQAETAKLIGIAQSDLSKIEKGLANVTIKMLHRIATGLRCKINTTLSTL